MEEKRTLGSYLKECEQLVKANSVHIESITKVVDKLIGDEKKEYKTCDKCCYDILDSEGEVMEHECQVSLEDYSNMKEARDYYMRKVILEQQALNRKIKAKEKSAYKKTFSIFNWYISENHYVEVFYDVIPKDYGDRETPSYPQYVEVSSMTLYGDDVTELFEHRIEEIEHEINNEIE